MISFFVAGIPKPMSVSGVTRFRRADKVHMVPKRAHTDWATLVGYTGRQHIPARLFDGGVILTISFFLPRPKSASRKMTLPLKRPDLDNLIHKLSDQFNGVFWHDDSQIVNFVIGKRFAESGQEPGVLIQVEEL